LNLKHYYYCCYYYYNVKKSQYSRFFPIGEDVILPVHAGNRANNNNKPCRRAPEALKVEV
jgi:hypothetical protein